MTKARQYRIGVVGFGVGGATASCLLARAGHEVSLFERAPVVGPVGAGILLQPSGQQVLKRMGLLDKVAALGEPVDELHALNQHERTLIRMPYGEIEPECRAYGLHRGDLFGVLHEAVLAQPIRVHLGHEIRRTRVEGQQVFLHDSQERVHGPFDFIVAADGSRSALRLGASLTRWIHEYAYGALWAIGHNQVVSRKLHQVVRGTHRLLGLLPMGKGRCSLFWGLRCNEKETVWKNGFDAWRTEVLKLCPLAAGLFETLNSFDQVAFTTYQHVWLRRPYNQHLLLLGDAAHAMSPHLGQGINLALLDAYLFSQVLIGARHYHDAFREYARLRQGQLRYFAWVTFMLTPFFQSNGFIKGLGRDLVLPVMTHLPWVRGQMLLTMAGLKSGFFTGKIDL